MFLGLKRTNWTNCLYAVTMSDVNAYSVSGRPWGNLRLDIFIGGHFLFRTLSSPFPKTKGKLCVFNKRQWNATIRTTKTRPRQLSSKRPTTGSLDITGGRLKEV